MGESGAPGAGPAAAPASRGRADLSLAELTLLVVLGEDRGPVGARVATQALRRRGIEISEASVSRLLVRLDAAGLTHRTGSKGRVLTDAGRRLGATIAADQRRNADFAKALDIRTLEQLLDLMTARRGCEREAVRAAALRATGRDILSLERLLHSHRESLGTGGDLRTARDFHRRVAQASHNRLLRTIADILLDDSLEPLEHVADIITGGYGTQDQAVTEHAAILDAIRSRDPDAAEAVMIEHLTRIIEEIERFAAGDRSDLFQHLLNLAQNETPPRRWREYP